MRYSVNVPVQQARWKYPKKMFVKYPMSDMHLCSRRMEGSGKIGKMGWD